ncbi:hypothetical protein GCM10009654_34300 [Streptomyces hebeiensis]|uniref:Uncharacterized protein n=1 Tax=Streptomyces hebeiensis TaxID=229486 RepID=A0ABP4FHX0_9ACTN
MTGVSAARPANLLPAAPMDTVEVDAAQNAIAPHIEWHVRAHESGGRRLHAVREAMR